MSAGVWTVRGGGSDIHDTADHFHFVWQSLAAGGSIIAHVTAQTNTNAWAKAGVMLRASTDPGAPNYALLVTPGNGVTVQYRASKGGSTANIHVSGAVPVYLQVARAGNTFSAYTSTDGKTWKLVAGSTRTINIAGPMLEGLAVTSHSNGSLCTATIDSVLPS